MRHLYVNALVAAGALFLALFIYLYCCVLVDIGTALYNFFKNKNCVTHNQTDKEITCFVLNRTAIYRTFHICT